MFCPYCGTSLVDGALFCMKCGKPIASIPESKEPVLSFQSVADLQVQKYQMQKDAARKSEINSLSTALSHFSLKKAQFKEYDEVCKRVNHYARGAKSALLVWGCIIAMCGLLSLMVFLSENVSPAPAFFVMLIPSVMMIVGGILMKVNNHKKYSKAIERYTQLSKELYAHYVMCPSCPVGAEYINPVILELLLKVLQSGRADTVRESINITIDDAHRAEVQAYLATIAQHTAEINRKTGVSTVFVAASFFF